LTKVGSGKATSPDNFPPILCQPGAAVRYLQLLIMKIILIIFAICVFIGCRQKERLNPDYCGFWGDTQWEFHFDKSGTYTRKSSLHYGNTLVTGHYEVTGNVVHLLSGFQNTDGTVNEYYILADDGHLVDATLLYDYSPEKKLSGGISYNSQERIEYKGWTPQK
jgi:hypothetical protein